VRLRLAAFAASRRALTAVAADGRPYDAVLMFRILVLQVLYTLSDEQA